MIADQLLADISALPREPGAMPDTAVIDQLVLTVHERINPNPSDSP